MLKLAHLPPPAPTLDYSPLPQAPLHSWVLNSLTFRGLKEQLYPKPLEKVKRHECLMYLVSFPEFSQGGRRRFRRIFFFLQKCDMCLLKNSNSTAWYKEESEKQQWSLESKILFTFHCISSLPSRNVHECTYLWKKMELYMPSLCWSVVFLLGPHLEVLRADSPLCA